MNAEIAKFNTTRKICWFTNFDQKDKFVDGWMD